MPKKKYLVDLSADEREQLRQLVRRGKHSARTVTRARILLLASDGATDEQIVAALKTGFATVNVSGFELQVKRPTQGISGERPLNLR